MRLIGRYVRHVVLNASVLVLLVVAGMEGFLLLIGELGQIGKGQYHFYQALLFVLLNLPRDLQALFPLVMLLGSVLGLSVLANKNELTLMRACGVSKLQLIRMTLLVALGLTVLMSIVGEGWGPRWARLAGDIKQQALSSTVHTVQHAFGSGYWLRQGNRFIHIKRIDNSNTLNGVTEFKFDRSGRLNSASHANQAVRQAGSWYLKKVRATMFSDLGISVQRRNTERWPVQIQMDMLILNTLDTDTLSLPQLWGYIRYQRANQLNTTRYEYDFWQRVLQPLFTVVMILLAVPFLFGSLRNMTIGLRLIIGIVMAFGFYILNAFLAPLSLLYQIPPLLAVLLPSMLVMGALVFVRRGF